MAINKQSLIERIQNLEELSNEDKSALINLLREHKKYGLVWEDKTEEAEELLAKQIPVISEVTEKAIISDKIDAPNHIIIEGDNLHALTVLSYTHSGLFDVIYIDPPYNTGAKNWKYNNDYVDDQDCFRHSKWISFMNKRLKIAKKLLSMTGIIVVTIDDYEIENSSFSFDECFESENGDSISVELYYYPGFSDSAVMDKLMLTQLTNRIQDKGYEIDSSLSQRRATLFDSVSGNINFYDYSDGDNTRTKAIFCSYKNMIATIITIDCASKEDIEKYVSY